MSRQQDFNLPQDKLEKDDDLPKVDKQYNAYRDRFTAAQEEINALRKNISCLVAPLADCMKEIQDLKTKREFYVAWKKLNKTEEKLESASREFFSQRSVNDVILLHVYFKQLGIIHYVRDELYSVVDFIGTSTARRTSIYPTNNPRPK